MSNACAGGVRVSVCTVYVLHVEIQQPSYTHLTYSIPIRF